MSKVTTFSRVFPVTHIFKGDPTFFVEQILNSLHPNGFEFHFDDYIQKLNNAVNILLLDHFQHSLNADITGIKKHTIRDGKGCKAGDNFSFRIWSNKPYRSKQIIFTPDIEIKRVADIEISKKGVIVINGKEYCMLNGLSKELELLSSNDGLTIPQFQNWLNKRLPFSVQIRIWDDIKLSY